MVDGKFIINQILSSLPRNKLEELTLTFTLNTSPQHASKESMVRLLLLEDSVKFRKALVEMLGKILLPNSVTLQMG